jgi:hypothetical protein
LHQVGDLFELNVKLQCQKAKNVHAMERWKSDNEIQMLKYFHYIKQREKQKITIFWDVPLCDVVSEELAASTFMAEE